MKSLSTIGLALSVIFGCLLIALVAEIYYLLWWKRRFIGKELILVDGNYTTNDPVARKTFHILCFKSHKKLKPSATSSSSLSSSAAVNPQDQVENRLTHLHNNNNSSLLKPLDENEIIDPYGLTGGIPRFLFTINEETKEDLVESEDGKSRIESRRLSDLFKTSSTVENQTPFLTPISSPAFFTPPITPTPSMGGSSCCISHGYSHSHSNSNASSVGYNPFLECSTDLEFNKIRSSPPPKFKFLRDAEEKLHRSNIDDDCYEDVDDEEEGINGVGSFIRIVVGDRKEVSRQSSSQSHFHSPQGFSTSF